jgi:AcrR family transcriptional regulator
MAEVKRRGSTRRPYHSPVRKQQAEQTRERILAAAREKFRSAGYAASTLEAIAVGAQVSTKTVEAAYGSKRGILSALVDPLASAGPPRELVEKIRGTDDPAGRVRLVAELSRRVYQDWTPEFELLRGAVAVAPAIAAVARQIEGRRRNNQSRLVAYLAERGALRAGLAPEEAIAIIWALSSYDMYRSLVAEQGWPPERYQAWLSDILIASVLADPSGLRVRGISRSDAFAAHC